MSHELRTPLNAIIGYSELLREEAEERGGTSEMADLDRIGVAGRHLLSLVNEVLDLSKVEAGKTELSVEEFDVKALIEEIIDTITPQAGARGNCVAVDCPPDIGMMRSDPTKLRQVLLNLLSNAAKFTEAGDIRLGVSRQGTSLGPGNPGNLVFTVSDTGLGIAPDQVEAAFTAFEQTDSSRDGVPGRHRPRPAAEPPFLRHDGRHDRARKRGRQGQHLYRPPAGGNRRGNICRGAQRRVQRL